MSEPPLTIALDLDVTPPPIDDPRDRDEIGSMDYSIYPFRFFCLFQDLAHKWQRIAKDCVVLVSDHILNNQELLVLLATNNLRLTEHTSRYVVDMVMALHREHPGRDFLTDGIPMEIDPERDYTCEPTPEVVFLRSVIIPEIRDVSCDYLIITRMAVRQFLTSDACSSFLLSFPGGSDALIESRLRWSDAVGYPIWHDWFPDHTVVWFSNALIRDLLNKTLVNISSGIWIAFLESPSVSHPPDVMRPVISCQIQKAAYVLAWLIVELRILTDTHYEVGTLSLTPELVRIVANECHQILSFLYTIRMQVDTDMQSALAQWVEFMPVV